MGVFDDLIIIDENANVSYAGWVEWKYIPMGLIHCPMTPIAFFEEDSGL